MFAKDSPFAVMTQNQKYALYLATGGIAYTSQSDCGAALVRGATDTASIDRQGVQRHLLGAIGVVESPVMRAYCLPLRRWRSLLLSVRESRGDALKGATPYWVFTPRDFGCFGAVLVAKP